LRRSLGHFRPAGARFAKALGVIQNARHPANSETWRQKDLPLENRPNDGAPGGKSAYWQGNLASPSRDMPVESFYDWPLKPYLRAVPGAEISALLSPSSGSFSGVRWLFGRRRMSCAFSSCRDKRSNSPSHSRRVESIYELHVPRVALPCCLDLRLWVSPADSFRADETTADRRYAE